MKIIFFSGGLTKRLECTTSELRIGQKKMAWIVGEKNDLRIITNKTLYCFELDI